MNGKYFLIAVFFLKHQADSQAIRGCPPSQSCRRWNQCWEFSDIEEPDSRRRILRDRLCMIQDRIPYTCCKIPHSVVGAGSPPLLPKICGDEHPFARIFGGKKSSQGSRPWVAALGYQFSERGRLNFNCGGSVISSRYVLTAAHCVHPSQLASRKLTVVRLGTTDLWTKCSGSNCTPSYIDAEVSQVIIHPNYNQRFPYSDDIALLRLKTSLDITSPTAKVRAICLPPPNLDFSDKDNNGLLVAGWGITEKGSQSPHLVESLVSLANPEVCHKVHKDSFGDPLTQICVLGFENTRTGSCSGDSGVPLIVRRRKQQQYTQIGLVSLGTQTCKNEINPSIYTSVSRYKQWIVQQIKF